MRHTPPHWAREAALISMRFHWRRSRYESLATLLRKGRSFILVDGVVMMKEILCMLGAVVLAGSALAADVVVGTVIEVEGLVTVSNGTTVNNVVKGMPVTDQSRFVASSTGSVTLRFDNGCDVNLRSNQYMTIDAKTAAPATKSIVTFFEREGFAGRNLTAEARVLDLGTSSLHERAASVIVESGRWEVCEGKDFTGRCVTLSKGKYDSLRAMGIDGAMSSARPVDQCAAWYAQVFPKDLRALPLAILAVLPLIDRGAGGAAGGGGNNGGGNNGGGNDGGGGQIPNPPPISDQ
jgi:hypothetical protein